MPKHSSNMQRDEATKISSTCDEGTTDDQEKNISPVVCIDDMVLDLGNIQCHIGNQRILGSSYSLERNDMVLKGDTIYNRELQSILGDILIDEYGYMGFSIVDN
jgi:hypothetical protein